MHKGISKEQNNRAKENRKEERRKKIQTKQFKIHALPTLIAQR
tara:strand:+ start:304 stop:432 length:129 start_codon:yes stop_codon:yes gene_type:complete